LPKFELLNGRTMEMHQVRYFLALLGVPCLTLAQIAATIVMEIAM
jgi:hypothetical protein